MQRLEENQPQLHENDQTITDMLNNNNVNNDAEANRDDSLLYCKRRIVCYNQQAQQVVVKYFYKHGIRI
jgi:hypothetical protein